MRDRIARAGRGEDYAGRRGRASASAAGEAADRGGAAGDGAAGQGDAAGGAATFRELLSQSGADRRLGPAVFARGEGGRAIRDVVRRAEAAAGDRAGDDQ